jgi:ferritin-like metal-binding protein YciE
MRDARDIFLHQLSMTYYIERVLTNAQAQWRDRSNHADLSAVIESHLQQTQEQRSALLSVFDELGAVPEGTSPAIDGFVAEANRDVEAADTAMAEDLIIQDAFITGEGIEIANYRLILSHAQSVEELGLPTIRTLASNLTASEAMRNYAENLTPTLIHTPVTEESP